jgi:hypothetical protein
MEEWGKENVEEEFEVESCKSRRDVGGLTFEYIDEYFFSQSSNLLSSQLIHESSENTVLSLMFTGIV